MNEVIDLKKLKVGDSVGVKVMNDHFMIYKLTQIIDGVLYDKYKRLAVNKIDGTFEYSSPLLGELNSDNSKLYTVSWEEES